MIEFFCQISTHIFYIFRNHFVRQKADLTVAVIPLAAFHHGIIFRMILEVHFVRHIHLDPVTNPGIGESAAVTGMSAETVHTVAGLPFVILTGGRVVDPLERTEIAFRQTEKIGIHHGEVRRFRIDRAQFFVGTRPDNIAVPFQKFIHTVQRPPGNGAEKIDVTDTIFPHGRPDRKAIAAPHLFQIIFEPVFCKICPHKQPGPDCTIRCRFRHDRHKRTRNGTDPALQFPGSVVFRLKTVGSIRPPVLPAEIKHDFCGNIPVFNQFTQGCGGFVRYGRACSSEACAAGKQSEKDIPEFSFHGIFLIYRFRRGPVLTQQ